MNKEIGIKKIEEFIKRVMVSDDVVSSMEMKREKDWDTVMTFTITIDGHSYKDTDCEGKEPPEECRDEVEDIRQQEREKIMQIVIEDVPHKYQDRLLKELT